MDTESAFNLLGLERGESLDAINATYREQKAILEEKAERAPTPGLRDKYQQALQKLDEAVEVLFNEKEDFSSLPVLSPSTSTSTTAGSEEVDSAPVVSDTNYASVPTIKRPRLKKTPIIVGVLCLCIVCGAPLWWFLSETRERQSQFDELLALVSQLELSSSADQQRAVELSVSAFPSHSLDDYDAEIKKAWEVKRRLISDHQEITDERMRLAKIEKEKKDAANRLRMEQEQAALLDAEMDELRRRFNGLEHRRKVMAAASRSDADKIREHENAQRSATTLKIYHEKLLALLVKRHAWMEQELISNPAWLALTNAKDFIRDKNVPLAAEELNAAEVALGKLEKTAEGEEVAGIIEPLWRWCVDNWHRGSREFVPVFLQTYSAPDAFLVEFQKSMDGFIVIGESIPSGANSRVSLAKLLYGANHPLAKQWSVDLQKATRAMELFAIGAKWREPNMRLPDDYDEVLGAMRALVGEDNLQYASLNRYITELIQKHDKYHEVLIDTQYNLSQKLTAMKSHNDIARSVSQNQLSSFNTAVISGINLYIKSKLVSIDDRVRECDALHALSSHYGLNGIKSNQLSKRAIGEGSLFYYCKTGNWERVSAFYHQCKKDGWDEAAKYVERNHPNATWRTQQYFRSECKSFNSDNTGLSYSKDGGVLAVYGGSDCAIFKLNPKPSSYHTYSTPSSIRAIALADDRRSFVLGGSEKTGKRKWGYRPYLCRFDENLYGKGTNRAIGSNKDSMIMDMSISLDSQLLLVVYQSDPPELWNLENGRKYCEFAKGLTKSGGYNSGVIAGLDTRIVLGGTDGIHIFELPEDRKLYSKGLTKSKDISAVVSRWEKIVKLPNQKEVAYYSGGGCFAINVDDGTQREFPNNSGGGIYVFTPDGRHMIFVGTIGGHAGLCFLNLETRKLDGFKHFKGVQALGVNPQGTNIAVYSSSNMIYILEKE